MWIKRTGCFDDCDSDVETAKLDVSAIQAAYDCFIQDEAECCEAE